MSGLKSISRCPVGRLSLLSRVVVVQVSSLFVVVVRCSVFGVRSSAGLLVLFDYPELSGLSPVRSAQSDNCGGN